ncbi:FAD-binding oxidoreductase [Leptospira sp. 96542]|nr:FAD-binding oxidoreductase [Leptospira sp. 96542]
MTTRNIYKWGSPEIEESLPKHTLEFLESQFQIQKEFKENLPKGELPLRKLKSSKITTAVINKLKLIVGKENVDLSDESRAKHSIGKFYSEIYNARFGLVQKTVDVVVKPDSEKQIESIVELANSAKIPVIPFGAGSSVTRALEAPKGGISLDLSRYNRILEFNAINATVTVEAGIFGPELESFLNDKGFTCGHFPQSFEFSTVGGWVAAKGAGQASTGYGKIEDIILALTAITPSGKFESKPYPAASIGPDVFRLFLGSEGSLGVISKVTLKIRKYNVKNSSKGSFIFKNFESAVETMREAMQAGFGKPHFFRVQDPEETDISFRMSGLQGGKEDYVLRLLGYKPNERSLMHIIVDGDADYSKFVLKKIKKIAKRRGGFSTGESPVNKWLHQRYSSAYLRDYLMNEGVRIDTLETAVTWHELFGLWNKTRAYIKSFPNTSCMVHISHAYETGANLYFIFLNPMDKENEISNFEKFHKGIIETIHTNGGSLSHHHGIGRMLAPWMEREVGKEGVRILSSVKKIFDPKGIMNPGGLLGIK